MMKKVKKRKRLAALLLAGAMVFSLASPGSCVTAEAEDQGKNLALNKDVSVSGLEVSDGRFTAPMAVDGEVSSTSRVSFLRFSSISKK